MEFCYSLLALRQLSCKLKATTKRLRSWSHGSVGHVNSLFSLSREILHQFEIAQAADCSLLRTMG